MNAIHTGSLGKTVLTTPNQEMIDRLLAGQLDKPQKFLGPHRLDDGRFVVRAFLPQTTRAWVVDADGTTETPMKRLTDGVFEAIISNANFASAGEPYKLKYVQGESTMTIHDPYAVEPLMSDLDQTPVQRGESLRDLRATGSTRSGSRRGNRRQFCGLGTKRKSNQPGR